METWSTAEIMATMALSMLDPDTTPDGSEARMNRIQSNEFTDYAGHRHVYLSSASSLKSVMAIFPSVDIEVTGNHLVTLTREGNRYTCSIGKDKTPPARCPEAALDLIYQLLDS